jgi:hypothetical protein
MNATAWDHASVRTFQWILAVWMTTTIAAVLMLTTGTFAKRGRPRSMLVQAFFPAPQPPPLWLVALVVLAVVTSPRAQQLVPTGRLLVVGLGVYVQRALWFLVLASGGKRGATRLAQ